MKKNKTHAGYNRDNMQDRLYEMCMNTLPKLGIDKTTFDGKEFILDEDWTDIYSMSDEELEALDSALMGEYFKKAGPELLSELYNDIKKDPNYYYALLTSPSECSNEDKEDVIWSFEKSYYKLSYLVGMISKNLIG